MDEVYVGDHQISMKEDEGSVNVKKDELCSIPGVGNTAEIGDEVLDKIPDTKLDSVAEVRTSAQPSTMSIPQIAVTDDDNGEVDLALEELVMTMVNEVIAESVEKASTESSTHVDEKGLGASLKTCCDEGLEEHDFAKQEQSDQPDRMVESASDVHNEDIPSKPDKDEQTTKMLPDDIEVEKASTKSSTLQDENGQGARVKSSSDVGFDEQELTKTEQSDQPVKIVESASDVHNEDIPSKPDNDEQLTKMLPQDIEVEKASTKSSTLPDEKGQGSRLKSSSDEGLEEQDLTKQEQSDQPVKMAESASDMHNKDIQSEQDNGSPPTKMALQDVEVIGQDSISKEVLFEVATLNVEEKEEKELKNRRESVTVDKPITQVEAAQVAEAEECADLIAQAKEVENDEGEEVVAPKEEKERKLSQVSLDSYSSNGQKDWS